jgi:hypothetical protein
MIAKKYKKNSPFPEAGISTMMAKPPKDHLPPRLVFLL